METPSFQEKGARVGDDIKKAFINSDEKLNTKGKSGSKEEEKKIGAH